jgi:serine/threonine-protein kinase
MVPQTTSEFVDLVRRSKLVDEDRLAPLLDQADDPVGGSGVICSRLIEAGLLTPWQSEQLMSGKSQGFFLGKYKVLDKLGRGGMSSVFLAEHLEMGRRVAVKVLIGRLAHRDEFVERFRQEARAAARVDHPNIVRAFDVDHASGVHYLVMEYIQGTDLQQRVEELGPLDGREVADTIRQAAAGLAHVHKAGLIHRDIKPGNLLVGRDGVVKIVDLGLARLPEETRASMANEGESEILGTVDYLAPEQSVDSETVSPRADIYSLGCTMYFLLTGQPPFPMGTLVERIRKHRYHEPEDIQRIRPDAPATLVAICERMMSKRAEDRIQSAEEVERLMREWLEGSSAHTMGMLARHTMASRRSDHAKTTPSNDDEELALAPLEEERPSHSAKSPPAVKPEQTVKKSAESSIKMPGGSATKNAAAAKSLSEPKSLAEKSIAETVDDDLFADLPPVEAGQLAGLEQAARAGAGGPAWLGMSSMSGRQMDRDLPRWLWGVLGAVILGVLGLFIWMIAAISK